MNYRAISFALVFQVVWTVNAAVPYKSIPWDDLRIAGLQNNGTLQIATSWGAVGCDYLNNAYVVYGNHQNNDGPILEDCTVFRYNPVTGERKALGTLRKVCQEAGTLKSGEEIPKGHSPLICIGDKVYFGTQNFHEAGSSTPLSDLMSWYHGSHLIEIDVPTGAMTDHGKYFTDGVLQRGQGMIGLTKLTGQDLLVGYSHPKGDILLYDPKTHALTVKPAPDGSIAQVARSIVTGPNRRVYTHYAGKPMQVFDIDANSRVVTNQTVKDGQYWNGNAASEDGRIVYVSTVRGTVYRVNYTGNTLEYVGQFGTYSTGFLQFCLACNRDGSKIYGIPSSGSDEDKLFEMDAATGKCTVLLNFASLNLTGEWTGFNARDQLGNIYFSRHRYHSAPPSLVQITVEKPATVALTAAHFEIATVRATPQSRLTVIHRQKTSDGLSVTGRLFGVRKTTAAGVVIAPATVGMADY